MNDYPERIRELIKSNLYGSYREAGMALAAQKIEKWNAEAADNEHATDTDRRFELVKVIATELVAADAINDVEVEPEKLGVKVVEFADAILAAMEPEPEGPNEIDRIIARLDAALGLAQGQRDG